MKIIYPNGLYDERGHITYKEITYKIPVRVLEPLDEINEEGVEV